MDLDAVKVSTPCPASWEAMAGDDKVRFCGTCRLNVYNLSGMSRAEAEAVVARREGRLCVRFYRRPDGTLLTKDCGILRAARRQAAWAWGAGVAAALALAAWAGSRIPVLGRFQAPRPMKVEWKPGPPERMGDVTEPEVLMGVRAP